MTCTSHKKHYEDLKKKSKHEVEWTVKVEIMKKFLAVGGSGMDIF